MILMRISRGQRVARAGGEEHREAVGLVKGAVLIIPKFHGLNLSILQILHTFVPTNLNYEVRHGEHTFNAKYAKEGNVLFFELTKDTDLTTLVNNAKDGSTWSLTDPVNMTEIINEVAKKAPAENYSLVIYGHGGGFDPTVDCPDDLLSSAARRESTRATLYDEWTQEGGGSGAMSMYNLAAAIKNSTVKLNTLFFHSCLMGNIECLSNVYTCADYIVSSSHVLVGVDCIMLEYSRALYEQAGTEKVISQMFNIPEFSLSLVLAKRTTYARTYDQGFTYQQAYESSEFHKMSGWGDWLKINARDVSRSIDGEGNVSIEDDDSK